MRNLVPALAIAALLAACGPQKDAPQGSTTVETGPDGSVPVAGPAADVNISEGASVTGGQQPAFAPEYPGGITETSIAANETGKRGGVYAFNTADGADKVFEFYRGRAEAAGLKTQTNIEAGGARIYGAQGPAGDISVTAAPQDQGRTHVQVTWSTQAP